MSFKNVMLGIGVGVLAALFIGFLVEAAYTTPKNEDYCKNQFSAPIEKMPSNGKTCDYNYNQSFYNQCTNDKGFVDYQYDTNGCPVNESCNYCNRDYQVVYEKYNRNLFYIIAPIALIMIILGLYLPASIDAIAGGSLFGGILLMIYVTIRVFGNLGKWTRVILLGLELILIIWIGIRKVKEGVVKKKDKT